MILVLSKMLAQEMETMNKPTIPIKPHTRLYFLLPNFSRLSKLCYRILFPEQCKCTKGVNIMLEKEIKINVCKKCSFVFLPI